MIKLVANSPSGSPPSPRQAFILSLAVLALLLAHYLFLGLFFIAQAWGDEHSSGAKAFKWREVEPGFSIARYFLDQSNAVLRSEVLLLRFDPRLFTFEVALASDFGTKNSDLRRLTQKAGGLAGINANFFDKKGDPLGLLRVNKQTRNRLHQGGNLLTGIFYTSGGRPAIVHRALFAQKAPGAETALQSGPRLIVKGKAVKLARSRSTSRRSGLAITRNGKVILFVTLLRFPGASLGDIQDMLLDPKIAAWQALNLDGGSSSQLFVANNKALVDDTFISGGAKVPVGLIVRRKGTWE